MRRLGFVLVYRLLSLVALFASAALVVDYRNLGDPAFCGSGSGCLAVRLSPVTAELGQLIPLPLPNLGFLAFVMLFGLSLLAPSRGRIRLLVGLSIVGGLAGAALFALQALVIRTFCPWCVAVDLASIALAVASVLLARSADLSPEAEDAVSGPKARAIWGAVAFFAVALPFVWGAYPVVAPLPAEIAAQQVPGKLTLVEFTDFECPYCRRLHPVLRAAEQEHAGKLAVVRRMMPLSFHLGATPAALCYLASPTEQRERVADALYAVDESELTRAGCLLLAEKIGLDSAAIARSFDAPETAAALESDKAMFTRLGQAGLPRTYVGARVVLGFDPERIADVLAAGLGPARPELPLVAMIASFVALASAVTSWSAHKARAAIRASKSSPA